MGLQVPVQVLTKLFYLALVHTRILLLIPVRDLVLALADTQARTCRHAPTEQDQKGAKQGCFSEGRECKVRREREREKARESARARERERDLRSKPPARVTLEWLAA